MFHVSNNWDLDKMADILQTYFLNAYPWMKMFEKVLLKFVPKDPIDNKCQVR